MRECVLRHSNLRGASFNKVKKLGVESMLTVEAGQTIASNFVICYQLGCFHKVGDNASKTIALSGLRIRGFM